jgi:DNA-binding response OmpR family regulator
MMSRILIVDDDPAARSGYTQLLVKRHHVVFETDRFRRARKLIATQGIQVAVLELLNVHEEGLHSVYLLRHEFPRLPLIVTCGQSADAPLFLRMALLMGANRGLTKPVPPAILAIAIDAVLQSWEFRPGSDPGAYKALEDARREAAAELNWKTWPTHSR